MCGKLAPQDCVTVAHLLLHKRVTTTAHHSVAAAGRYFTCQQIAAFDVKHDVGLLIAWHDVTYKQHHQAVSIDHASSIGNQHHPISVAIKTDTEVGMSGFYGADQR